jgi:hypothetical protein
MTEHEASFSNYGGHGFRMTFANGWAVSVQWGEGYYCELYWAAREVDPKHASGGSDTSESHDAEVAIIDPKGSFEVVEGYRTPDQVAATIEKVSKYKPFK